jgi:hypothetical protein
MGYGGKMLEETAFTLPCLLPAEGITPGLATKSGRIASPDVRKRTVSAVLCFPLKTVKFESPFS